MQQKCIHDLKILLNIMPNVNRFYLQMSLNNKRKESIVVNLNNDLNNDNNNSNKEFNKGVKYFLIAFGCGLLLLLICATCGKSDSDSSYHSNKSSPQSFEEYLKDTDPDSYEFYKGLEKGYESGTWDSENGFYQP